MVHKPALLSHLHPDTAALENAWFLLLRFQTSDGTILPWDEYLVRLKLTSKAAAASKARAEGMHFGKKSERSATQATTETVETDFINDSQLYKQFLINEVLQPTELTTNIVKGLAAFDLDNAQRPMVVAFRHFDMLYSTFALRSWVPSANESLCQDQYKQLLHPLPTAYGPNFDVTSISGDLIEFLLGLEFLQDRADLLYLFKICCLCTTTVSPVFPDVTFGNVTTKGRQDRFTDVILLCQSHFANVRNFVVF